jgi:hypothetical protein
MLFAMHHLPKKLLLWLTFAVAPLLFSGCLHIVEEVTVKKDGSGTYKLTLDMSEMKAMLDAFKEMGENTGDKEENSDDNVAEEPSDGGEEGKQEDSVTQLGTTLSTVAQSLRSVTGLSDIQEFSDTVAYLFGYSFQFADIEALNKAIRVINREKYENKVDETFRFKGGNFERLNAADIGEQFKMMLTEIEEEDDSGNTDMARAFFASMTYKQVYSFPDAKVKKSSNPLSELSSDGQKVTIVLKPFDEEQQKKKPSVATAIKLK